MGPCEHPGPTHAHVPLSSAGTPWHRGLSLGGPAHAVREDLAYRSQLIAIFCMLFERVCLPGFRENICMGQREKGLQMRSFFFWCAGGILQSGKRRTRAMTTKSSPWRS